MPYSMLNVLSKPSVGLVGDKIIVGTHTMTAEQARQLAQELLEYANESEAIAYRKLRREQSEQTNSPCGKTALDFLLESLKEKDPASPTKLPLQIDAKRRVSEDDETLPGIPAVRRTAAERQILIDSALSPKPLQSKAKA